MSKYQEQAELLAEPAVKLIRGILVKQNIALIEQLKEELEQKQAIVDAAVELDKYIKTTTAGEYYIYIPYLAEGRAEYKRTLINFIEAVQTHKGVKGG